MPASFSVEFGQAGAFHAYVTSYVGSPPPTLPPTAQAGDIPATTPASDAVSRDLKKRGFRFMGSTIVYAFMQSAGFVDDHLPGCFLYHAVKRPPRRPPARRGRAHVLVLSATRG